MFAITTKQSQNDTRVLLVQTETAFVTFPSEGPQRQAHEDAAAYLIHRLQSTSHPRIIGSAVLPDWSGWVHLVETDEDREQQA